MSGDAPVIDPQSGGIVWQPLARLVSAIRAILPPPTVYHHRSQGPVEIDPDIRQRIIVWG